MDRKLEWNLTEIFDNKEEIDEKIKQTYRDVEKIEKYKGTFSQGAEQVLNCYKEFEKQLELLEKIFGYAMLNYNKDMSNIEAIKLYKTAKKMYSDISVKTSFITPELTELEDGVLEKYLEQNEELRNSYGKSIEEIIKNKKHVLSSEVEEVLANYSEVFGASKNIYEIFTNTEFVYPTIKDEKGNELKVTDGLFSVYLKNRNESIRKQAFESVYSLYKKHINTISELYLTRVKNAAISSRIRKYESSLDAATNADDSNVKVYNMLIEEVNKNLDLNYKYMNLKKKILKLDKMHIYDVYVNPLDVEEKETSYEEAIQIVLNALQIMGKEYTDMLKFAFDNAWLDVYEKDNKMSGAYSLGIHTVHPFVLLNYVNSSRDVSTIAHELGHAMHSYYASKNQNIINADYTIMVAEVASTVNEILLAHYLINEETDKNKKAALINEQLDMIRSTLIRQSMFAEFEKIVHSRVEKSESLTSDNLNNIYFDLVKKYFGDEVELDEEIKYEWARIPHFYSCFYVYKYSTGITSAIAIASKILEQGEEYVKKYINMLSLGGSKGSLELLKMVEVDLEKEETYEIAFKYFKERLEELEKLVD